MSNPGPVPGSSSSVARFNKPVMATSLHSGAQVSFSWPSVPVGLTWTGNFIPCIQSGAFPSGSSLTGTSWTLTRNGQAELTWIGYTVLEDFQAYSGDIITITGYGVPTGAILMTWVGWSDQAQNVPIMVASLSNSGDPSNITSASMLLTSLRLAATNFLGPSHTNFSFMPAANSGKLVQIWNVELSVAMAVSADNTLSSTAEWWVGVDGSEPSEGTLAIVSFAIPDGISLASNQTVSVPCNGWLYDPASLSLGLFNSNWSVSDGLVVYSAAVQFTAF